MNKRKIIISGVAIIVIMGLAISLMGLFMGMKKQPDKNKKIESKKYVKTTPVKYTEIPTQIIGYGRVKAAESLDLIAEISGKMSQGSIPLKEGQKFSKGTLLFKIDDQEAKLNLQAQKSNFLRDIAAILPDFKIDFKESYSTWNTYFKSINLEEPLPELPKYASEKEKTFLATKNIFSTYYTIKSAESNMRKYRVYAPFSGVISQVLLQNGSFVNPGSKVAQIIRTDRLELKIAVPVEDIAWVKIGQQVDITTEDNQANWSGRIVRIGEFVNQSTQSIDVHVKINPDKNKLYDGLYLGVKIPGTKIRKAMEMPRGAIVNDRQVYIIQDSILKTKDIKIHKVNSKTVIFSGLKEGEDLVIEPLVNAHNNMVVYKLSDKPKEKKK